MFPYDSEKRILQILLNSDVPKPFFNVQKQILPFFPEFDHFTYMRSYRHHNNGGGGDLN